MDDSETEALTDQTEPEPEHAEPSAGSARTQQPLSAAQPYQPAQDEQSPSRRSPIAEPAVVPRTRVLGAVVSIFFPGVGSMINGNVPIGILILVGWIIAWFFTFFIIGIPFLLGFWAWGIIDGALSADRWNREHGIIS
jgi:TM2 domain-containing membrane protein YozV